MTNFIFQHLEVWDVLGKKLADEDENMRHTIKVIIPAVIGAVSSVIGIAGTIGATFFHSMTSLSKIASIGQATAGFAQGLTTIGTGVASGRAKFTESELKEISAQIQKLKFQSEASMSQMQELFDTEKQYVEGSHEYVKLADNVIKSIQA